VHGTGRLAGDRNASFNLSAYYLGMYIANRERFDFSAILPRLIGRLHIVQMLNASYHLAVNIALISVHGAVGRARTLRGFAHRGKVHCDSGSSPSPRTIIRHPGDWIRSVHNSAIYQTNFIGLESI
jgi:hypothetical protein